MSRNTNVNENNENNENNELNVALQENVVTNNQDVGTVSPTKINEKKVPKERIYIVETPEENFSGIVAGVHFAYGKAEVKTGWVLNWFKEKGYKVTEKK